MSKKENVDDVENKGGTVHNGTSMFLDAKAATEKEHKLTVMDAFRMYPKAVAWSVFVSAACVMEGYDTAFLGQLYAEKSFSKQFGVPYPGGYQVRSSAAITRSIAENLG